MKALGTLCIIAMAAVCSAFGSGISVDRLQCEFLTEPLAIDNTEPELSWKMASANEIKVKYAGKFTISIDIPVGSSATVCLPDGTQCPVLTSGHYNLNCNL